MCKINSTDCNKIINEKKDTNIKEIRLTNFDSETVTAFEKEFDNQISLTK